MNTPLAAQVRRQAMRLMLSVFLALSMLAVSPVAMAQDSRAGVDLEEWQRVAVRAERVTELGLASTPALEALRGQLVEWRARFLAQQDASRARLATLRGQLEALGPAPEADATEPPEIAARRAELTDQLQRAAGPQIAAEEAFRRADGLIREIDRIIRDRQAEALVRLGPSPLNPALWPRAAAESLAYLDGARVEIRNAWAAPQRRADLRQNLPVILALLAAALVLILRARRWGHAMLGWIGERLGARALPGEVFVQAATAVALPVAGLWMLAEALAQTGLAGPRGLALVDAIVPAGLAILAGRWLGNAVFVAEGAEAGWALSLPPEARAVGRRVATALGMTLALRILLDRAAVRPELSETSWIVLSFPVTLAAGLLLIRLALLLGAQVRAATEEEERSIQDRVVMLLSRGALLVALAGPVMAAIGYFAFARATVDPAIHTLGVVALAVVLQGGLSDLYRRLYATFLPTGAGPGAGPGALVPSLIGITISLSLIPILLLVWGAREADLLGLLELARSGVALGEARISLADVLTFVVIFAVGYTLTRLLQATLRSSLLPNTRIDPGGQAALVTGTGYVGIFVAALAAITSTGLDLSNLAIVAGALSVGIGFGLQAIVSNFVSGIILLVERPIKIGDWVEVGGVSGWVRRISVRSTTIETFHRSTVIVPNADLISQPVTNWTHTNLLGRVIVKVGVAYGTDPRKVEKILLEVAEQHPMVLLNPPPTVLFTSFGADSLEFEIRAILRDVTWMLRAQSDMNYEVARRFEEEGVEVPFSQRDLWLRNAGEVAESFARALHPPAGDDDGTGRGAAPSPETPPPGSR
ncbi:MAG: mechanosensitive ion channel family protein [Rhodobacteraceae bacterium]|nr:mechanosensitive ion channel family protein [Paracoccaceae bacterium]